MYCVTTLNRIWRHSPCEDGWDTLVGYLGRDWPMDKPIPLVTVLESNGFYHAIWCLQTVDNITKPVRLYAAWCVQEVMHLIPDDRTKGIVRTVERYAAGKATEEQLDAAWRKAENIAKTVAGTAAKTAAGVTVWAACLPAKSVPFRVSSEGYLAHAAARQARLALGRAAWYATPEDDHQRVSKAAARDTAVEAACVAQEAKFIEMFCTPTGEESKCTV